MRKLNPNSPDMPQEHVELFAKPATFITSTTVMHTPMGVRFILGEMVNDHAFDHATFVMPDQVAMSLRDILNGMFPDKSNAN